MVRVALFGVIAVSVYVTACRAACHCARVAVAPEELKVRTPVDASYEPAMFPIVEPLLVKASKSSPPWKLPVTDTAADARVPLPASEIVMPASIATGVEVTLSPATNDADPESAVTRGGPMTSTTFVEATLLFVPSLVTKEMVRLPGVALAPLEKVTASSALCHCASVAVAPVDVNVRTPVAVLYEAAMLPYVAELVFVKASVSPLLKPAPIETVPDACVVLSWSTTVTPPSIAAADVPPT